MFTGSYVALVTPMFENGDIDYKSLEKLVKFHVEQGTHGIVSVGTTGESATLPFDEHINVVKETVAMASGAIPVIAGSGANSTAEAIFLTEQLGSTGIDGFLSVVPYYNKPQQAGMVAPILVPHLPTRARGMEEEWFQDKICLCRIWNLFNSIQPEFMALVV